MLHQKLKEQTATAHQQIEKIIVGKIKTAQSAADYLKLLNIFYGYFKPLEERIEKVLDKVYLPDYEQRRKTASLKADISYLSGSDSSVVFSNDLPDIGNSHQAIGALYVMEGSTLGGKFIKAMLMKSLNADGVNGFDFFHGYGDKTDEMWSAFKSMLDTRFSASAHQEIIDSANDTFIKFRKWAVQN